MLDEKKRISQLRSVEKAFRISLLSVFKEHKPLDRTLNVFFRENKNLGSRDRALISECVFGLFRCWGLIRRMLPQDMRERLEEGVISIKAIELRAILFAVMYIEEIEMQSAGVLTNELGLIWPKCPSKDILLRAQAVSNSFGKTQEFSLNDLIPQSVIEYLPEDFPLELVLKDLCCRPPMWLRSQVSDVATLLMELKSNGLNAQAHFFLTNAICVQKSKVNLFTLESFKNGEFEVQDLASQCIGEVANPAKGERWLDCCAGAGGKSLQLADKMQRTGKVVASDIRAYKLDELKKRSLRAKFPNIITREWDGKAFKNRYQNSYNGVLVDAPCSCSGVWRRNPDGRWNFNVSELEEISNLQLNILKNASTAVKDNGVLIYATCSIFEVENRGVVEKFLAEFPEFKLEEFPHPLTGENVSGMLQVFSFNGDCDSMFVARMRKQNSGDKESV